MLRRLLRWWRYGRYGIRASHGWEDDEGNFHPTQHIVSKIVVDYGKGQNRDDVRYMKRR